MNSHVWVLFAVVGARPFLHVPQCSNIDNRFQITQFQLDDSSGPAPSSGQTSARLCVADDALHVHWRSVDNYIYSNFTSCNDPLFKQDAVEIFLALDSPRSAPFHYVEFEVSPFGVLFNSLINNPSGSCEKFSGSPLSCAGTGVNASAARTADGWTADLAIPFLFLELELGINLLNSTIYGNLFRIDMDRSGVRTYSAWVSTDASPPCFHKPQYFGALQLQPKKTIPPTSSTSVADQPQLTETSARSVSNEDPTSTTSFANSQAQFNFFFASFDRLFQSILIATLLHAQI